MTEKVNHQRAVRHVPVTRRRSDTAQSPGMTRFEGVSGRTVGAQHIWLGENHVAPHVRSANHHHGDSESAIYVVSGHPAFVYWDGEAERRIEAGPGDYVFVPPWLAHREENPGTTDAVVVLARSTQDAIVVNLDRLDQAVDGPGTDSAPEDPPPNPTGDGWHRTEREAGAGDAG